MALDEDRHRFQECQKSFLLVKPPDETDKAVFFPYMKLFAQAIGGREPEQPGINPLPHDVDLLRPNPGGADQERVLRGVGICNDDRGDPAVEQPVEKCVLEGKSTSLLTMTGTPARIEAIPPTRSSFSVWTHTTSISEATISLASPTIVKGSKSPPNLIGARCTPESFKRS